MRFERDARGEWIVDPSELAAKLGITLRLLQDEMHLGLVHTLVEAGHGGNEGRSRITVRCREAAWRGVFDAQGRLINECRLLTDQPPDDVIR
ncbi:DUF6522 family protein [Methylobacterium durans]|uniref:Uncharacterized protein n=1 Tax=Methylobacterium durans TaxID=2202825 RepID=A0A2U8WE25_9HYPH|nr:DUF6522 family protein [Methylobacterium durans]AWN44363.1 hypothetical protein DK389_04640 [Methylobacterium durans]